MQNYGLSTKETLIHVFFVGVTNGLVGPSKITVANVLIAAEVIYHITDLIIFEEVIVNIKILISHVK